MFPRRYFPNRYFPGRFFPHAGAAGPTDPLPQLEARAAVARAGVIRSGLTPREIVVRVAGVTRGVMPESFAITHTLGQPAQFAGRFNNAAAAGFEPLVGQELVVSDDTSGQAVLFGGTIVSRALRFMEIHAVQDPAPRTVAFWDVQARDWTWLMDKQARVYQRFDGVACNVAVARLLDLCDPALSMRVGSIPQSLGTITRTFDGETVSAAIGEIAKAANAFWRIRPNRRIEMFRDEPLDGNALLIDDTHRLTDFTVRQDLDQVRTLVEFEGGGGQTTAEVLAGATEIPVNECGWYVGARLKVGHMRLTYSGRSAASGPGLITGVAGLTDDVATGATVSVLVRRFDTDAQTALAARLGGGYTGVVMHVDRDNRLSHAAADGAALQNLTFWKTPTEQVSYSTEDRFHWPGKLATVALTTPAAYSATLRLQSVSFTFRGLHEGTNQFQLFRAVTARPGARTTVLDLLAGA